MSTSSELEWHCVSNMTCKKIKKSLREQARNSRILQGD